MSDDDKPDAKRFNYNIHYGEALLAAIPAGARTAVDVGCGEGFMARRLAEHGLAVTAIDEDAESIRRARAQGEESITYLEGDALTDALPAGPYDVVLASASLHHMDLVDGLTRLKSLVAPGGVLLVVGMAKAGAVDIPREMAASIVDKGHKLFKGYWDHGSPCVWPTPQTYVQVRDEAARLLPGSEFSKKLLWRYTLVWHAPARA
ncbi:bifunctional 2-polyprenyl-6-hydroxyphenol methylase/3-demethylubiquinol 3-O-methyltransferase UbiG [Demequina sp. NBRC 110057]|uniref:class I SAM-dependent methyltransferase n=1 Tax=Demequina sp. NBRC 110057 TaxID=1570346 RepID=UPI000A0614B2|nr:class I SAM-dependent methyltransferase [Demequina sp. NBRC 110057]